VFDVGSIVTVPVSINQSGDITGWHIDASFVPHGFLRDKDGTITKFDVPGAVFGTSAESINPSGEIAGWYSDARGTYHGFLRNPDHHARPKNELNDKGGEGPVNPE
jgi:hypothetical protein